MKKFAVALALTCSLVFASLSFGQDYYSIVPDSYGQSVVTQTYSAPTPAPAPVYYPTQAYSGSRVTYSTQTPVYNTYSAPRVNTPVRDFFGGTRQAVQNAAAPKYLPGPTTYGNVYSAPQPKYQQVTETKYKRVCRGKAGCTYEPYTVTYMKRVQ